MIIVDVSWQTLSLLNTRACVREYAIATASRGVGQQKGSEKTPVGRHVIRAKIGAGADPLAVFVSRRLTGERYTQTLAQQHPERDWILGRILWLSGKVVGQNRLGSVDTMSRFIYIHGQPPEYTLGEPSSHGCIRMHPHDLVDLFDRVTVGEDISILP